MTSSAPSKSESRQRQGESQGHGDEAAQTKPQSESKPKRKPAAEHMICNPAQYAYKLAERKAKMRAIDRYDPNNHQWKREFNRHTHAVETIKPFVDTTSPKVNLPINRKRIEKSIQELGRIEKENAQLLNHLKLIYKGETKTKLLDNTGKQNMKTFQKDKTPCRKIKEAKLAKENTQLMESLKKIKPTYDRRSLRRWYEKQQNYMDKVGRYPPPGYQVCSGPMRKVMELAYGKPTQYAYLQVEMEDKLAENITVELYADKCPFTVKNFQKLCINTKATACECRTYRCKKIGSLRSVQLKDGSFKKLYWVVGEHVDSTVEYSSMMMNEHSDISHTEEGLVTRPIGRAGGAFFITANPCPALDKFCYVFGKIDGKGKSFLKKMEEKNTGESGEIKINLHITDCGVVGDPSDVPLPMLLHDFIENAKKDYVPMTKRDPQDSEDWKGGKKTFADYFKERAKEGKVKHDAQVSAARSIVDTYEEPG